ncbi:protein translocase subunit SecF [Nocardioides marmoraquaticus]
MGRMSRLGNALYEGDVSVDFVGRKWLWYAVSALIVVAAASGLLVKGLNFGIEFEGGVEYQAQVSSAAAGDDGVDAIREAVADTGIGAASNPQVTTASSGGGTSVRVQTEAMPNSDAQQVRDAIAEAAGVDEGDISTTEIGPSWGAQVAERALTGLVVFLVLVVLFIWAYFREWKMSVAALVALAHDVIITVGVYAWSGFEVTPSTVTGLLTILGFSLYDTVVVFDKVRENTRNLARGNRTYAQQANLAVNQTLVRSVNTSIVALLPVFVILWVSITTLGGSGSLQDLALSLFVGMAAGAYSSVFIATPLAVHLKQGEKEIARADDRARSRARRGADRYADVPVFHDGMAADDEQAAYDPEADDGEPGRDRSPRSSMTTQPRTDRLGSGRTVPESKAPMGEGGSSKRSQPRREPRSKRK